MNTKTLSRPHLLLADDHTLFREALLGYITRALPDAVVDMAENLMDARGLLITKGPYDLVMLDWCMPGMGGIEDLRDIIAHFPQSRFAVMSGVIESHEALAAIDGGVVGYFPKTLSGRTLIEGIHQILRGGHFIPYQPHSKALRPSYLSEGYFYKPQEGMDEPSSSLDWIDKLTMREREVLRHLVRGHTNSEIGDHLHIKLVTVKLHVRNICRKVGVRNRTEAALRAVRSGFSEEERA